MWPGEYIQPRSEDRGDAEKLMADEGVGGKVARHDGSPPILLERWQGRVAGAK